MTVCTIQGRPKYILDLIVEMMGYHMQHWVEIGFKTESFEKLGPSYGYADRHRYVPEGYQPPDGPAEWMANWTVFYWGGWLSWCPFVGMIESFKSLHCYFKQSLL